MCGVVMTRSRRRPGKPARSGQRLRAIPTSIGPDRPSAVDRHCVKTDHIDMPAVEEDGASNLGG